MAMTIEQDLERMVETITINANYPYYYSNLNILLECDFYFDVCQIIFPELSIKLIKIRQNQGLAAGVKMQHLLATLSRQLQIDLSSIEGNQIVKGHLLHIHHFLQLLEKFSQLHQGNGQEPEDDSSRRVKSDGPNTSGRVNQKVPRSAREQVKHKDPEGQRYEKSEDKRSKSKKKKKTRPHSASRAKKGMNSTNVYGQLFEIMMTEKNRALTASMRDNRKKKNQSISEAKNKFKSYLVGYAKQERASRKRKQTLNKGKKQYRELPLENFNEIENHFRNFAYKLRDTKYCYLKRLQKTIRTQEMDRMCFNNRILREQKKDAENRMSKELERINHEHGIRRSLLKEQKENDKEASKLIKKQYERYLRTQKKQLKENKKQELKKIKDFIDQENEKVLMNLEEGGSLEKIIYDMYKRL